MGEKKEKEGERRKGNWYKEKTTKDGEEEGKNDAVEDVNIGEEDDGNEVEEANYTLAIVISGEDVEERGELGVLGVRIQGDSYSIEKKERNKRRLKGRREEREGKWETVVMRE